MVEKMFAPRYQTTDKLVINDESASIVVFADQAQQMSGAADMRFFKVCAPDADYSASVRSMDESSGKAD